ncbi:unnamed protein product [Amoebophrya sp. A120]|nr:unnamed protein product [Amoebophrya sp. A120]|eukprot:GSA120T00016250001.1
MQSSIADPLVQHQNPQQQAAGRRKPGSKQALFRSVLLALTILGSGVLAGLYFIFSVCVMPALDEQPDATVAIDVMNSINVVIINEYFMLVFMGTPILAVLLFLQELRFLQLGTGAPNAYATYQPVGATSTSGTTPTMTGSDQLAQVATQGTMNNTSPAQEPSESDSMLTSFALYVGCILLFIGEFGVTAGINVPMNDELAKYNPEPNGHLESAHDTWAAYSKNWTYWNSIRGVNSATACLLFTFVIAGTP